MIEIFALAVSLMQEHSPTLDASCKATVRAAEVAFPDEKLQDGDIALSVLLLGDKALTRQHGGHDSDQGFYPASVVKFFYLVYAAHELEAGRLQLTDESTRAVRDMIVDSNNDATGYVIDWVCGTTPGPELAPDELKVWIDRRQAVNRWYESLGYKGVNACNRTFNEGPYGRESQLLGDKLQNRNRLTPDACTRLMADLMQGKVVGAKWADWAKGYLKRAIPADTPQASGFVGSVLPKGSTLFSKAGWVDTVRHDVAGCIFPDGRKLAVAIFTKRGKNVKMIPWIAGDLFKRLGFPTVAPPPYAADPD